jgi:hypothetical protein
MEGASAAGYVALTVSEIRKLLWQLTWPFAPRFTAIIRWSLWRRHHQAVAREHHYRRRSATMKLQL